MGEKIYSYEDLRVYQNALNAAMGIYRLTKDFPQEEKYSMVDQMRRSSRSVCANLAEAWCKRRYRAAFIAKLSDAESEASETRVWVEFACRCGYIDEAKSKEYKEMYHRIISQMIRMISEPEKWLIP